MTQAWVKAWPKLCSVAKLSVYYLLRKFNPQIPPALMVWLYLPRTLVIVCRGWNLASHRGWRLLSKQHGLRKIILSPWYWVGDGLLWTPGIFFLRDPWLVLSPILIGFCSKLWDWCRWWGQMCLANADIQMVMEAQVSRKTQISLLCPNLCETKTS